MLKELSYLGAGFFCGTGGEAVVAHAHEAFWQYMQAPTSDEFVRVEFEDAGFLGGAVGPFEEDAAALVIS